MESSKTERQVTSVLSRRTQVFSDVDFLWSEAELLHW